MNCDAKMHIKNKTNVNWSKNNFYCLPYLSQIGKSTAKSNTNKVQPLNVDLKKGMNEVAFMDSKKQLCKIKPLLTTRLM